MEYLSVAGARDTPGHTLNGYDPVVISYQDRIFQQHLLLPLDF